MAETPVRGNDMAAPGAIGGRGAWRQFAVTFTGVFLAGLLALWLAIVAVDPFDAGRFSTFVPPGSSDTDPRTANAGRGRDLRFNAAIVGNSHLQLLSPQRLLADTGLQFVQLTIPGSGPREQIAVTRWFAAHHPAAAAIVLGVDSTWCGRDAAMPLMHPFPFWLYDSNNIGYLAHLLNARAALFALWRVRLALGMSTPADPTGYRDYERDRPWAFHPEQASYPLVDLSPALADDGFPAVALLRAAMPDIPPAARLIAVMPPQFRSALPADSSAADLRSCKASLMRLIRTRPGGVFLDYLLDTPATRDPANFMDATHYRASLAIEIERSVASAVTGQTPLL